MNINSSKVIEVLLIVAFLIFGFMFIGLSNSLVPNMLPESAQDVDAVTYLECFESPDVNETNPDGMNAGGTTIYTYAETDWILANVTDLYGAPVSDQCYWVNDSDGDGCYSTFTFASKAYTSASFYFMMNSEYHEMVNVSLEAADGSVLLRFNISDTEISCHNATTELWDEDITSGVWYYISVALNWEGTFTASLYSVNIAGTLTAIGGGTGDMSSGVVAYGSCAVFNVSGDVGSDVTVYIDNIKLYKAAIPGAESRILAVGDAFFILAGIIIFVIILTILIAIMFTMKKKQH